MKILPLLCIICGFASLLRADAQSAPQATPPPLAPGPLLVRAPAESQWLISVTSGTATPVQPPDQTTTYIRRVLVRKSGDLRLEITVSADGHRSQKWCKGAVQANVVPGQQPTVTMYNAVAHNPNFTDYSTTDFPGFDWISPKNYIGVEAMEGFKCIVFHDGPMDLGQAPAANPSASGTAAGALLQTGTTAYIMADQRLPVLLDEDGAMTLYQFETPSSPPPAIPADVESALNAMAIRLQRASAPAAVP